MPRIIIVHPLRGCTWSDLATRTKHNNPGTMLPQVSETHPLPDVYLDRGFLPACIKVSYGYMLDSVSFSMNLWDWHHLDSQWTTKPSLPKEHRICKSWWSAQLFLESCYWHLKLFPNVTLRESFFWSQVRRTINFPFSVADIYKVGYFWVNRVFWLQMWHSSVFFLCERTRMMFRF